MFFKIPGQCIVCGSAFPIACYLVAHVFDAPIVYEIMGQKFESFNGLFQLSFTKLITFSSIQMRNVWLLGCAAHLLVRLATQRNWTPVDDIWGCRSSRSDSSRRSRSSPSSASSHSGGLL